jgi:hypothetical protein
MIDKPQNISGYTPGQADRAERVLLEIWSRLGDYHEHLVLVGGLAPRYLVPQNRDDVPKHCGTLDVDLAVSLAVADVNAYAGIRQTLERIGLRPGINPRGNEQRHSFVIEDGQGPVIVDFLTTRYDGPNTVVRTVEEQLSAIQVEGLGLALKDPVIVAMRGESLNGGIVNATLQVCRPVPFVVLKALAFENRREGKDVHDLVYILRHSGGTAGLAGKVTPEEHEADAFGHAMKTLRINFGSPMDDGPVRYSRFLRDEPDAANQAFAVVQEFLQALKPQRP